MKTTGKHPRFRVGDWVRISLGRRKVRGVIREDRGNLGVGGRRLFRVEIPMDPFEPRTTELPEDEMEAIAPGAHKPQAIDKEKIIEYMVCGGLLSILRSNLSGGKNQPVWLCLDNLENVTYTFTAERGVVGGQLVPLGAIWENKINVAKQDQVTSFIESFGLSPSEAEQVVSEVGKAAPRKRTRRLI